MDADIRILRCIERDLEERNMSVKNSIDHYLRLVRPMHKLYVEPSKEYAEILVPEGGQNHKALTQIISRIDDFIIADDK